MADEYNRLAMYSAYSAPVAPVENRLALPAGHPSNMLMWLRDQIPQVQADDSSTMSGITSRLGRTATAIPRAGLETMSNWLRGTHDPNAVRIGEDTIAPLGLLPMAGVAVRAAGPAKSAADRVWHHGTDAQFDTFQARAAPPYSGGSSVPAVWMTSKPRVAEAFAEAGGQSGRVIDATVNAPNLEVVERGFRSPDWETMDPILQRAKEAGKDGVLFKRSNDHPDSIGVDPRFWNASDVMAVFNPSNIRPAQASSSRGTTLLADNARSSVPGTVVNAMGEQPQTIRAYHGSPYARPDGKLDASKINPDEPGFFFSNDPWLSSQYVKHGLAPMDVINGAFDESLARGYMELLPDGRSRVVDRAAHDKLVREIEGSWLPNGANVTPVDIDPSKLRTIDLPGYRWDQDEGAKIAEAARAAKAEGYAGLNIRGMREGRDTRPMPDSQRPDVQTIWEPGHVKSATTGDTIFSSPSSAPGLAASASQQDDNPVLSILSKYGLY